MCYTTNSIARLPAPHSLTHRACTHSSTEISVSSSSLCTFGQGTLFMRCLHGAQPKGRVPQCHSASAQPVNKHCSGWDHTRGQKLSPDLWRSRLKLYLLSYTSFSGRAKVPEGGFLQSSTERTKQNRFIPVQESGPYTFVVNKLQNVDIFHALPHTCKFIQTHQPCQHLSRWLPFN